VAFYQVSFFQHPIKYDSMDCFFPWRYHVGECLQNGQFPYWNPFQDLGYPIHADPSSGAWYPIVWIIGFFNGYSVYTIGFEMWLHVFFAGIGFYWLARTLKFDKNLALLAGIAYMLCGLFVGNAQHLPYIISATWLPFVLNFYFKMVDEKSLLNCIKASFFLFLMVTGGYPAFTIILFYLLLIFFIIYFIRILKTGVRKEIWHFILRHGVFFVFTILLCLGMLFSVYQVSPYMSRLGDFELEQALFSPFSPQSFVSFILPFVSTTHTDYFNSDLSMRNGYFGILVLLFFCLGIFTKKPMEIRVLFFFGIFSLLVAVGEYLPFREILYKYVPMMNVFRFPSVFRLFFIIAGILTGVYWLKNYIETENTKQKPLFIGIISMIVLFIILIITARSKGFLAMSDFVKTSLFTVNEQSTYWQNAAFQSVVQIGFLGLFIFIILKIKDSKKIVGSIIILTLTEMIVATQLNAPYTVYFHQVSAPEASKNISVLPSGFPPVKNRMIEEAGHLPGIGTPFWQNLNIFQKEISAEGFNSFSFTTYDNLESEYPQLFSEMKKNRVVLLSDTIVSEDKLKIYKKDSLFTPTQLFFSPKDYRELSKHNLHHLSADTAYISSYDAAHFTLKSKVKNQQLLTLFQKEYTGWKAFINDKEVRIYKSDMNFMTVIVPPGENTTEFRYINPPLKTTFYISALSFLFALGCFIYFPLKTWRRR